jgi:two-component system, chemotaxis family, sensor kinase CheA
MSLSAQIREQLLRSFRTELAEHVQTMNEGLLAIEQGQLKGAEQQPVLENVFRAAHSLKGAARAVGAIAIEQIAHALESVLDGLRGGKVAHSAELFTTCYHALDIIRLVQSAYEAGETTPPVEALQALAELGRFQAAGKADPSAAVPTAVDAPVIEDGNPSGEESEKTPAGLKKTGAGVIQRLEESIVTGFSDLISDAAPDPAAAPVDVYTISSQLAPAVPAAPVEPALPKVEKSTQFQSNNGHGTGAGEETIRVSVAKLDMLMAQLSELLVTKMRTERRMKQVNQFQEFIMLWQKEWINVRSSYSRMTRRDSNGIQAGRSQDTVRLLEFMNVNQEHLRQMGSWVNDLRRDYTNDSLQMTLVIDRLEEEIKRVRMLPLHTITASFGRMVRDMANSLGKEAILQISGAETELDKQVLEQVKDPLIHLLRNSIDHGIELPALREAAGKPRAGMIRMAAAQNGKDVVISITDDGGGLDLEGIRRTLSRTRGDASELTEGDLVDSIFQSGLSTRTEVTDFSGRGLGLDVVRRNVEGLNGRIEVDNQPGIGVTFRLTLPLRLTGTRGLLVRVTDQQFVLPIHAIERIMQISKAQITQLEGYETILYNGRPVTLVRMGGVLEMPQRTDQSGRDNLPVVILASSEQRSVRNEARLIAFVVDDLMGEQEVVIKELGRPLVRVGGVTGAAVMGSGDVVLILNPNDLIKMAVRGSVQRVFGSQENSNGSNHLAEDWQEEHKSSKRILVVDDSITTRTLEKNILEAAGYTVQVATDGEEVLSIIATDGMPDLIISDVTMPRMNGFELTRRVKTDPQLAGLPVILVTSLESPEDKARGIEVGADAYIVKGRFDQTHLLETVEQLI